MIDRRDVFKEIISPEAFNKAKPEEKSNLLYKAVYMGLRLLLDVRWNIVQLDGGENIKRNLKKQVTKKEDNPVIKVTDNIEVKK